MRGPSIIALLLLLSTVSCQHHPGDSRIASADGKPHFIVYPNGPIPNERTVELDKPNASDRWRAVIESEGRTAKTITEAVWKEFPFFARLLANCGGAWLFGQVYRSSEGPYQDEIALWARSLGIGFGKMAMINCAYELNHVSESLSLLLKFFFIRPQEERTGCSAGIVELQDGELVHVRNLDWPIDSLGPATRVLKFRAESRNREFIAVTFPGAAGVLSGMVPGGYSVTINWAPPLTVPTFDHSPSLLLRKVLETCGTYAEATNRLSRTTLSTSVFYTVCGARPGEGCIIERTPTDFSVRTMKEGFVAQSNHFDDEGKFSAHNWPLEFLENPADNHDLVANTRERRKQLERALTALVKKPWDEPTLFGALDSGADVTNPETCQRILFRPMSQTAAWHLQTSRPQD